MTPRRLRALVRREYEAYGRHALPWRRTRDPYKILVSEVMLQQTQVERVVPYYQSFLKRFPRVETLAEAPLSDVLRIWQGLGYNRRAKMLHEAANVVVREYGGRFPKTPDALEKLPGIGHYTARAVAAFAYNADVVMLETNIRTVLLHHLFPDTKDVTDAELLAALETLLPAGESRIWYWSLMDYGSALKRAGVRTNARQKGYVKQSTFKGSSREARGAVLKALAGEPRTLAFLANLLGPERKVQMIGQIKRLYDEGLIEKEGRKYQLPH